MGISIDVTDRKRAEEAQRASEARLAAGAELAGLGFYEVDYGEETAFFDARLRDLLGVPAHVQQGLQPVEFYLERVHPDDRQRFFEEAEQLIDGGWNGFHRISLLVADREVVACTTIALRATLPDTWSSRSASSATSRRASESRKSCAT
jgi:PAS domain-containing protein